MRIDGLARTLENSQGMVHGRKRKAVSLKSTEQRIDTGSMHAALSKQAFASAGLGLAISMPFLKREAEAELFITAGSRAATWKLYEPPAWDRAKCRAQHFPLRVVC